VPRAFETYRRRVEVEFRALHGSPLGRTALLVDLEDPATSRLEVFDLAGRRVRVLVDQELPAGASVIPWDGREDNGTAVRRGVYFARLTTPAIQRTLRLLYAP
jgi:flagellar hook assembly protein FlgD